MMEQIDWTQVKTLDLPRVGQLGFVVEDVAATLPAYAALYGIGTWYRSRFVQNTAQVGERRYEAEWEILFGYSGKVQVELIDLRGDRDNSFGEFLERHGPGLHHLGFFVSDLDQRVARAERLGIEVLHRQTLRTEGGFNVRTVFLDTAALCGMTLELAEVKMGRFNLPTSRWLMEVGVLLGDGEKVRA